MRVITAQSLDAAAYAPFGGVIGAGLSGAPGAPANQGTARRFDRLAPLVNLRSHATPNVAVFRSTPWPERPVPVRLLERHASSTQLFVPMNARRYLVVVALGDAGPDLDTLRAFVASGTQGISYGPGVWHHPLIALDAETDFACVVFEDGTEGDCDTVVLAPEDQLAIALDAS